MNSTLAGTWPQPMHSPGFSDAAAFVAKCTAAVIGQLQDAYSLGLPGKGIIDEIQETAAECAEPNWNGYRAMPVEAPTVANAIRFIRSLPLQTPPPSVGAEADGHLTLEWYRAPNCLFSISVSPEGPLHYAALIGSTTTSGSTPFCDEVPDIFLFLIGQTAGSR